MKRHARILLADGDLASTAALGGVLEAAHYAVRVCADARPRLPHDMAFTEHTGAPDGSSLTAS